MAGKYQKFRGKIPAATLETSYQERVDQVKNDLIGAAPGGANVSYLAAQFVYHKEQKDSLEESIKQHNLWMEALSQMLVEQLEGEQMQTVKLSSGATVFLADSVYPSVKDKDALMAWIREMQMEDVLIVHSRTLQGIVGERLIHGETAPPGVECYLKTVARVRFPGTVNDDE